MPNKIEERIRLLANQKWQAAGCIGQDLVHWLAAEREILDQLTFAERYWYLTQRWLGTTGTACLNFFIVALGGGVLAWWTYRCTDWAETALGIFTLGAFVSFAALIFKLLPKVQAEQLQNQVFGPILQSSYLVAIVPAVLLVLFFVSTFAGSIEVEGGKGGGDARVWAFPPGADPKVAESAPLSTNGRVRFPCWTTWSGRNFRLKVTGLPEKKIVVAPWLTGLGPQRFLAPADFLRPILLIGADSSLVNSPSDINIVTLHVSVTRTVGPKKDTKNYQADYSGRAVWIGCEEGDLDVPRYLKDKEWASVLSKPETANRFMPPVSLTGLPDELEAGDVLTISLTKPQRTICEPQTLTVRQPTGVDDMIQVVTLIYVHAP